MFKISQISYTYQGFYKIKYSLHNGKETYWHPSLHKIQRNLRNIKSSNCLTLIWKTVIYLPYTPSQPQVKTAPKIQWTMLELQNSVESSLDHFFLIDSSKCRSVRSLLFHFLNNFKEVKNFTQTQIYHVAIW